MNARIVGAIARLKNQGHPEGGIEVDPSLARIDDETEVAFATYSADRWDD